MRSIESLDFHPTATKLVDIIVRKTQKENHLFFHILVAYYFAKMASMMRADIVTHDRGNIPVNLYAVNLASSGQGKGHSTNIVEEHVIDQFRETFTQITFPAVSTRKMEDLALKRSFKKNSDVDEERAAVLVEFQNQGTLAFSFDSGTTAAVKQMRQKMLIADIGSMNMEIDEIGSNLLGNVDVLTTFLELYDVGKVKQKLTKNTAESVRSEEIDGRTPTNMMLFGTPSKLFNGSKVEDEFVTMLETGYARRCLFGISNVDSTDSTLTREEIYDRMTDVTIDTDLHLLSDQMGALADEINYCKAIKMSKDVALLHIEYQMLCEKRANAMPEREETRKAEMTHRFFKSLKLAGAYAFIDGVQEITEATLYNAIKLTETSGEAFDRMLTQDRPYVKLAKYLASIGRKVTHVDLVEDLPFYKGGEGQKREMVSLAIAYGYQNNIIIKKILTDNIEFLEGESLALTDIDKVCISYSTKLAEGYQNQLVPFDKLSTLTQRNGYHWVAHHLSGGYRTEENSIPGFNLVVLDVDDGVSLATAKLLMKEHKYLMYTTKSSTEAVNRFRIILPMSHTLKLDAEDYKEFMSNIYDWLPFDVDKQTNQRSRKWMSYDGDFEYNDGTLLDSLLFIPKTTKNEERKLVIDSQHALSNMERWFVSNTGSGNRSNQLIKYALMLVDSGMTRESIQNNVMTLNSKLSMPMEEMEILSTIMVTAQKAILKRIA